MRSLEVRICTHDADTCGVLDNNIVGESNHVTHRRDICADCKLNPNCRGDVSLVRLPEKLSPEQIDMIARFADRN